MLIKNEILNLSTEKQNGVISKYATGTFAVEKKQSDPGY